MKFDFSSLHFSTPVKRAHFEDDVTYIAKNSSEISHLIRCDDNHGYIVVSLKNGAVSFFTLQDFERLFTSPADYYPLEGRDLSIYINPKK